MGIGSLRGLVEKVRRKVRYGLQGMSEMKGTGQEDPEETDLFLNVASAE